VGKEESVEAGRLETGSFSVSLARGRGGGAREIEFLSPWKWRSALGWGRRKRKVLGRTRISFGGVWKCRFEGSTDTHAKIVKCTGQKNFDFGGSFNFEKNSFQATQIYSRCLCAIRKIAIR
jgi:hypothetical protein